MAFQLRKHSKLQLFTEYQKNYHFIKLKMPQLFQDVKKNQEKNQKNALKTLYLNILVKNLNIREEQLKKE